MIHAWLVVLQRILYDGVTGSLVNDLVFIDDMAVCIPPDAVQIRGLLLEWNQLVGGVQGTNMSRIRWSIEQHFRRLAAEQWHVVHFSEQWRGRWNMVWNLLLL